MDGYSGPLDLILWHPVVRILTDKVPSFRSVVYANNAECVWQYPDGSLHIVDAFKHNVIPHLVTQCAIDADDELFDSNVCYRSRASYESRKYKLVIPISYYYASKEMGPVIRPTEYNPIKKTEYDNENITIIVSFVEELSHKISKKFQSMLYHWQDSICQLELGSNKGIENVNVHIAFDKRQIRMKLKLNDGEQKILNWLNLSILEFGRVVYVVDGIYYDGH